MIPKAQTVNEGTWWERLTSCVESALWEFGGKHLCVREDEAPESQIGTVKVFRTTPRDTMGALLARATGARVTTWAREWTRETEYHFAWADGDTYTATLDDLLLHVQQWDLMEPLRKLVADVFAYREYMPGIEPPK